MLSGSLRKINNPVIDGGIRDEREALSLRLGIDKQKILIYYQ